MNSQEAANMTSGIKVVALGGGTGLANLLYGLKQYVCRPSACVHAAYVESLTAIVAVTDDGGSSGRLRADFNVLAPGDIRNCIVSLSENEGLLSRLFQHRFKSDGKLNGHSFGNLFITALTAVTGDFGEAVKECSRILSTCGQIYPVTCSYVELEALMADGSRVRGESKITSSNGSITEIKLVPPNPKPLPQALEAIAQADVITIGPGSLFTSLVPTLIVPRMSEALAASSAMKVLVCNLMTEPNESLGLSAADHIRVLRAHGHSKIIDYIMLNQVPASREVSMRYLREGATEVEKDIEEIEALGVKIILGNYLEEEEGVVRHDPHQVAADLVQLRFSRAFTDIRPIYTGACA